MRMNGKYVSHHSYNTCYKLAATHGKIRIYSAQRLNRHAGLIERIDRTPALSRRTLLGDARLCGLEQYESGEFALAYFNAEHGAALAFHDEFAAVLQGARKILLLVLDGMGWYNLERAHGRRPLIRHELRGAACWPLTSMFPSTTSAVMSSLTTGVPPAQHGVIGYLMYFPEYGRVFNMLSFTTPGSGARRSALLRVRTGNLSRPADDLCPPGPRKSSW